MSNFPSISELLQNTAVRIALAIVGLMAVGSLTYYLIESQPPKIAYATISTGSIVEDVTATGTVDPVQNPTLSFEVGGQVKTVSAVAGQKVSAGTFLASLDTGILSASLAAAEAKLNQLESGPRSVDVAGQQTGVLTAQQALSNTYANYPQSLASTLNAAQSAINTDVDPLFDFSAPAYPVLITTTSDSNAKVTIDSERSELNQEFATWQSELSVAGTSPTPAQLQTLTTQGLGHLTKIRSFLNDLIATISVEPVTGPTVRAQQAAALASSNAALASVNGLITSLTNETQSVTTEQLAIQSAQDQLNQTTAGADTQDIQAQEAAVNGIKAQIGQQEIVAPFSGTIASVSIKPGDAVSANTPAISLIPNGTFEVDLYLAENDVAKVKEGDAADVTLDAYGAGRIFPATVGTVETSPSIDPNSAGGTTGGYKVTLVFTNPDPAIVNGMHASATIHAGSVSSTLIAPSSAIITNGTSQFVLKKTATGLVKTPVTVGLVSTSTVEILSGLSEGDVISAVGAQ